MAYWTTIAVSLILVQHVLGSSVTVDLVNYGSVTGISMNDAGVTSFLGIPYASPPIGKLRFSPPEAHQSWSGERDCTSHKPACPQNPDVMKKLAGVAKENFNADIATPSQISEDCLYLNVYVPGQIGTVSGLPVMVHFHDGNFQFNWPGVADGEKLAKSGNVIVVTVSFRLGALGFYGKGNYGLFDQSFALKWVQANIRSFGGEPDQTTIFGSGSGAFAVGLHVLSPASRGLFRRAISQGGSANQAQYMTSDSEAVTSSFGEAVQCDPIDFDCLRNLPLEQIMQAQQSLASNNLFFSVAVDGEFLPTSLDEMVDNATFGVTDYMFGFNNGAGSENIPNVFAKLVNGINQEEYKEYIEKLVNDRYATIPSVVLDTIQFEYEAAVDNDFKPDQRRLRTLIDIHRDAIAGDVFSAQLLHSKAGLNVFAYYFDQTPPTATYNTGLLSAPSRSENLYLFGKIQNTLSEQVVEAFTSFAKTGIPSITAEHGSIQWPVFDETTKHLLILRDDISTSNIVTKYPVVSEKRMKFWSEVLPNMTNICSSCEDKLSDNEEEGPVVTLGQGDVRGKQFTTKDNYTFEVYSDIPFGNPPVGELRWKAPTAHPGWSGILEPRKKSISCLQQMPFVNIVPEEFSEDCLHLDVYVPQGAEYQRNKKLPVMIFIHGGGFSIGSKNIYNSAGLTMYDVVVVTINYRLGVLGFMSTEDDYAPGNYGLLDQQLAIKWVISNIERFGGNPDEITLFGESAGAASVALQMLAPSNKNLFKRVISLSGGSILGTEIMGLNHRRNTIWLAKRFNCSIFNSYVMLNCLRQADPTALSTLGNLPLEEMATADISMFPRIDGVLLPKRVEELYEDGVARDIQLMTGTTRDEGYMFFMFSGTANFLPGYLDDKTLVGQAFMHFYADLLRAHARGGGRNDSEYVQLATDYMTDSFITAHSMRDAELHSSNGGQTYRYLFRFRPAFSLFCPNPPDYIEGAHGEDLTYVFGHPVVQLPGFAWALPENFTWPEEDVELSKRMMKAFANFAHNGDLNNGFDYDWPPYTKETPNVFEFRANLDQAKGLEAVLNADDHPQTFRPKSMKFWNELFPSLKKADRLRESCEVKSPSDSADSSDGNTNEEASSKDDPNPADEASSEDDDASAKHEEL